MSNKFVVKCGNFAVLVDLHVLPQGTSKDTSWFSDHEKEEICTLLRQTIETRVTQHMESRRLQGQVKCKEYTQASPLFVKGTSLRIAAYFIKRWVNLRCAVKHRYRELYVFPDRFVVCASQLDPASSSNEAESVTTANKKDLCNGVSEYFAENGGNYINNPSVTTPRKQAALKNIVKKTKAAKDANSKPGSNLKGCSRRNSVKGRKKTTAASESACTSSELAKHGINTPRNSSELPNPEVEYDINPSQACGSSSQHKPQFEEWLQTQDLIKALSWSPESALLEEQQTLRTSITQHKRRRHSSEGKAEASSKKANLRDDTFISQAGEVRAQAIEDVPLALRILACEEPWPGTSGEVVPVEESAVIGKVDLFTDEDKLNKIPNTTAEERGCDESSKPASDPTKKLKRQRIKKSKALLDVARTPNY
ncbi:protein SLX4IP isoform X2 [Hyperolius riggenbachi]|uniref:protein SLX4IP isoform X2 n=1 Tax=Hyperolius riggenbachi TaxID=752182 RepID=UPI0035A27484